MSLAATKRNLRQQAQLNRQVALGQNPHAPHQICDRFLREIITPPASIIATYMALLSELDPSPLAEKLHEQGHQLCLPVVVGKNQPLEFRYYHPGDKLVEGPFNLLQPAEDKTLCQPHILLVPLLAYDRHGNRLGYGGGYYDRTLHQLRANQPIKAIGLAFAEQEIELIPTESFDQKLDLIVNELAIIWP